MSSEKIKKEGNSVAENVHLSTTSPPFNEKAKGEIGVFKARSRSKMGLGAKSNYRECFSNSNFASQYEDECPVNYSLKYSETEPCKGICKREITSKKFKDFTDYAETDLDQPMNFSLKYAEKTCDEENKSTNFNYYNNCKVKFKEFTDYVEIDLDQPTDFTLKYRESTEEDVKNLEFSYYESEEGKTANGFGVGVGSEGAPSEPLCERYVSQNETPMMFSRSSSMNSLSSFVHITQSIPDDRSSIISDFSRMTSGIISPSELPDSPTQTAPSSPKRQKSLVFSVKPDFLMKQSVFEDDLASYKQEDTPVEFSGATSLSSLNIENSTKSEAGIKHNLTSAVVNKEESQTSMDQTVTEHLKQQNNQEKLEHDKGKFELASVLEVDESPFADCISMNDIQINSCRQKPKTTLSRLIVSQENSTQFRQSHVFPVKSNFRLRFNNESRKGYFAYEGSDDAVHTYHTEGTPANVSHAGSHSDLSALSIASGIPHSGVDDNSDQESFPGEGESVPVVKAELLKINMKDYNESKPVKANFNKRENRDVYITNQPQINYMRKDHALLNKDEVETFAIENSPSDISIRSSLSDLTLNVVDVPLRINRAEICEEPPSQVLSPLRNVSPQSPNSMVFEENEETEKSSDEPQDDFVLPETVNKANWAHSNRLEENTDKNSPVKNSRCLKIKSKDSTNFDFYSKQPLTPFEEALLKECIRLGMPKKKTQKQVHEPYCKLGDEDNELEKREGDEFSFSKFTFDRKKLLNGKSTSSSSCRTLGIDASNVRNAINFDFDSSEPLTPFEEVLLEQCIRLGMPQKRSCKKIGKADVNYLDKGSENFDMHSARCITPLETALLEQCIRLGMPQRKSHRRGEGNAMPDESIKTISYLTANLNKLKLNSENEKEKDSLKRCEHCSCGKRHGSRKKNTNCKKSKTRLDHFKIESCPV